MRSPADSPTLGLTDPALFETDEEIAASALTGGVTLEMVREPGWLKRSPTAVGYADGRTVRMAEAVVVPDRPAGDALQLLTPKSHFFLNTTFANMPRQRSAMKRPTLDMHPSDAAARGLADGEEVEVRNDRGAVRVWLRVSDALHPGVVALPGKWWGTPQETSAVANLLSPSAFAPHGQPAYNDTFVQVKRHRGPDVDRDERIPGT